MCRGAAVLGPLSHPQDTSKLLCSVLSYGNLTHRQAVSVKWQSVKILPNFLQALIKIHLKRYRRSSRFP